MSVGNLMCNRWFTVAFWALITALVSVLLTKKEFQLVTMAPFGGGSANPIPVVDISNFLKGQNDAAAAKALASSLEEFGVVRVSGLGRDLSKALADFRKLFALGVDDKEWEGGVLNRGDGFIRGYIPPGKESGLSDVFEIKEGFCYGHDWPQGTEQENPLQGPNMWPRNVPRDIKRGLEEWYDFSIGVAKGVGHGLAAALDLPYDHFADMCKGGETISIMRLFRYLNADHIESDVAEGKARLGSSPHRDWHFVTIILQDDSNKAGGGLEIEKDGRWWPVDTNNDELLVLGGEYLSLISQGRFQAPVHRVLLPPTGVEDRMSGVLFYYPNFDSALSESDVQRAADADQSGAHNSLVSYLAEGGSCAGCSFGELMLAKWAEVLSNTS